jgi:putative endonuclease
MASHLLRATRVVFPEQQVSKMFVFLWSFNGNVLADGRLVPKRFVYVLRNSGKPARYYTGVTSDVSARLAHHNSGQCSHTAKHRPWAVDLVMEFGDQQRALAFERYLKSGSGVVFAQRHLR